ncbi:LodA/GoxA family CTQ-dependent oxidase [Xanthobacter sp. 91]|uniref:LodA/GoxA family CTQ-dependent oxidase n=1 Tax=Xanthobacter sp. 91 TaxID=1117244 RepID=UPI000B2AA2D7|nr:LodA/GoxA family CTQ-dependent oxidase [Xanthobacter sp. 91]
MDRRDLLKGAAGSTLLAATSGLAAADDAPTPVLRIHPAIGVARIGNSPDYYLAPETAAGELPPSGEGLWGGLPLDAATGQPLTADGFRDAQGRLKRQAVRFRIYAYTRTGWPTGESTEITLGAVIGGKRVVDIVWQVHVANKKLNTFGMMNPIGHFPALPGFADGKLMPIRRPQDGPLESPDRLRRLVIDPGPRALSARTDQGRVLAFDRATPASCLAEAGGGGAPVHPLPAYPVSFPQDHFRLHTPADPVTRLGDVRTEAGTGRLIFAAGFGAAEGITSDGSAPSVSDQWGAENTDWFDDMSDGPVSARIVFEDGTSQDAAGAWATCGDPGFAPQTRNVVTAWDEVYDTFVRALALEPALYADGAFNDGFSAAFADDAAPLFRAIMQQRWNTNLPAPAIAAHNRIGAITPADSPTEKIPDFSRTIRNPSDPASLVLGAPVMPLALGDTNRPFLTLTPTQYHLLRQWHKGVFTPGRRLKLGAGEELDRVALANCLGGRFSPGIEVSYPVRDPNLYVKDWANGPGGAFRVNAAVLDYSKARADAPFLSVGYIPLRDRPLEPGDMTKFMAVPWHSDFNHCASHLRDPNPGNDQTLYWSWPAERPVAVYPQALARFDPATGWVPGRQLFAVRGAGTTTVYPANAGRFQKGSDFLVNWHKVGFVVQASRINPDARPAAPEDPFLEVACFFENDTSQMVAPWPTFNTPPAP